MTLRPNHLNKMAFVRLLLIHQPPGAGPLPKEAALWRTCVREIAFVEDAAVRDAPVVADAEAYSLLVEVVSGLRSPLVGETEVQSQFKAFLSTLDPDRHGRLLQIGQRVLADAKFVRSRHLQGLGTHSYGPLVAERVPRDRHVVVVGTGALSTKIVEALDPHRRIDRWGRRPLEDGAPTLLFAGAEDVPIERRPSTLIVAARASASDLQRVASRYERLREVFDLRARDERHPFPPHLEVMTLDDLFGWTPSPAAAAVQIGDARREIRRLSQAFGGREELHPFGWDDLCG